MPDGGFDAIESRRHVFSGTDKTVKLYIVAIFYIYLLIKLLNRRGPSDLIIEG
jgi:hypothetical protein